MTVQPTGRTVLIIQHLAHEHEGVLGESLAAAGVMIQRCRAWADPIPASLDGVDALVVLGGDMNTDEDDRWPHLRRARDLLRRAVAQDMPTIAICLGAQLLAEAVGGSVSHGTPEIGHIPVLRTAAGAADPVLNAVEDGTKFFNAHQDFIMLPPDVPALARSADAPVHAFRAGRALGLQFHAEIDATFVAGYIGADGVEAYLGAHGWTGESLLAEARAHNDAHRAAGRQLFDAWVDDAGLT